MAQRCDTFVDPYVGSRDSHCFATSGRQQKERETIRKKDIASHTRHRKKCNGGVSNWEGANQRKPGQREPINTHLGQSKRKKSEANDEQVS